VTVLERGTGRLRGAFHPRRAAARFLDRPYASVQLLLVAGLGLLGVGVLMSVSTTIAAASDGSAGGSIWSQMIKQALFLAVGVPLFWFAVRLSPRAYRLLVYPVVALALAALVAVLVPGIGVSAFGAQRWIDLGPLQVQPSELGKLAMLLWGADLLARKQQLATLRQARHLFLPLLPGFLVFAGLVMLEPDLGTTCCFVLILLGLLWMVGMPLRYFVLVLAAAVGAVLLLGFTASYRLQRLTTFLHPFQDKQGSGFHTVEGLYALASGGIFGVGLGQGTSKYGWVPNANSDYVFAVIGEELGLIGCLAVLSMFGLLAFTGLRIARRNADPFVRIAAGAATVWLCGQALINVGYVTGLLPVTGIPLPFISAGGTSLLASIFVLGMLVCFARHEPPAIAAARKAARRGTRSRLERWTQLPVPQAYVPPKRRRGSPPLRARHAGGRSAPARPASRTPAAGRRGEPQRLRPTGTDGRRRPR
jgi:cell division protein FtsW